eukprot:6485665-Amphidinium_carterae.1
MACRVCMGARPWSDAKRGGQESMAGVSTGAVGKASCCRTVGVIMSWSVHHVVVVACDSIRASMRPLHQQRRNLQPLST